MVLAVLVIVPEPPIVRLFVIVNLLTLMSTNPLERVSVETALDPIERELIVFPPARSRIGWLAEAVLMTTSSTDSGDDPSQLVQLFLFAQSVETLPFQVHVCEAPTNSSTPISHVPDLVYPSMSSLNGKFASAVKSVPRFFAPVSLEAR